MKFAFNPIHRVAYELDIRYAQTIYFAVLFVRTIIACRYFYSRRLFFSFKNSRVSDFLEKKYVNVVARFWDVGNFRGISCSEVVREMFPKFAPSSTTREYRRNRDVTIQAMTYFYSDDDLRRQCRFHLRFLFHRCADGGSFRFAQGVCVRVLDDSIHFPRRRRTPRNANKQVSEPVSQTSKHVVAVSCCFVGAEVTRISRREFKLDVGW